MPQQRFTLIKSLILAVLIFSTAISCKKSNNGLESQLVNLLKNPILIPGTKSFIMGSSTSEAGRSDDETLHEVALNSFYISKYELSRGEFKPFLLSKDTSYLAYDQRKLSDYTAVKWTETDAHPIVKVSWNTAIRYCNWLTKQIGSTDTAYVFDSNGSFSYWNTNSKGVRLPTETEWEYACRANSKDIQDPFSTGNNISASQANFRDQFSYGTNNPTPTGIYLERTVPVDTIATYHTNAFGLRHMHGNVWEWCYDGYGSYPTSNQTNPIGTSGSLLKVYRGGGWQSNVYELRSANRENAGPSSRFDGLGLRLAKTM